ncbi:MAG: TetR/AcrR family transcriptional regulator [Cytophagales bacterium]|nr:TetR/AcrR family transcriptional regulator [Cytophagales bacterium]
MAYKKSADTSLKAPSIVRREPVQSRAQQTIHTIFLATAQIVEQDGVSALSTNKIAQKAGFSIGTLYQYFPTKEAILHAMTAQARRAHMNQLHQLLLDAEQQSAVDFEGVLRQFIHMNVQTFAKGSKTWRALVRFAWRHGDNDQMIAATRETSDRIAVTLSRKRKAGWRAPTPALIFVLTRAILGAIRSAALEDSSLLDGEELEDELVRLALGLLQESSSSKEEVKKRPNLNHDD